MKEKSKIVSLLLAICFLGMTSCQSLYDIAPKSYGEWDGNYIYCGNVRCKTTGEEDDYLIETLEKDGVAYTVMETTDCLYEGDDIYMCLQLQQSDDEETYTSCLARYDIKDKNTDVLYWETEALSVYAIYKKSETFWVLQSAPYYEETYTLFKIDYDGNVLSADERILETYKQTDEYLVNCHANSFSYRMWEEDEWVEMFSSETFVESYTAEYIEQDGKNGFLIRVLTDGKWRFLYFYDMDNEESNLILSLPEEQEYVMKNGYVMTYLPMEITLVNSSYLSKPIFPFLPIFIPEKVGEYEYTYRSNQNCKLYRIDLSSQPTLQETYDFSKKHAEKDFSDFTVLKDGRIYFYESEVAVARGCQGRSSEGNVEYNHYVLKDGKLKKTSKDERSLSDDEVIEEARKNGAACGKYIYYRTYSGYGGIIRISVMTLWRYDTETKKTEAMQFCEKEYDRERGFYEMETEDGVVTFRYAPKLAEILWEERVSINKFIVRNY